MVDHQQINFALVSSLVQLLPFRQKQLFFSNVGIFIEEAKHFKNQEFADALYEVAERLNHDVYSKARL